MELAKSLESGQRQHLPRLNRLIQVTLLTGLVLSMVLMAVGAILYLFQATALTPTPHSFATILSGVATGDSLSFMHLGIVTLMVTPALCVLAATLGYVLEKDWVFALVSVGVAAVLTASVLIGAF